MATVEDKALATQENSVAAAQEAYEAAYQIWFDASLEMHHARNVFVYPCGPNTNRWNNILRGAATTVNLFPHTLRSTRCRIFLSFVERSTDALNCDWYNVGRDLFTVLRKSLTEAEIKGINDERPCQDRPHWPISSR